MGGKQSRGRNKVYLCVAALIFLAPLACALGRMDVIMTDTTGEEARAHLDLGRKFLSGGNYKSALEETAKVLTLAGKDIPVGEALFYTGLIHAHPANPARDYGKSLLSFEKMLKEYPENPLAEQAQTILGLIQENIRLNRAMERLSNGIAEQKKMNSGSEQRQAEQAKIIAGLQQENDRLTHMVVRLHNVIDELKKVDIDVEQKKRTKRR